MTEGPHCPKCGSHCDWVSYANGDAQQCAHINPRGLLCAYIHWLRNPPADAPDDQAKAIQAQAERDAANRVRWALEDKRKRVRKLVHSLIRGGYDVWRAGYLETVSVAERMDSAIEAVTKTEGSDS